MTVQWQTRSISLGKGMDDNTSKPALISGRLLKLINGQFNKQGGIAKRLAFDLELQHLAGTGELFTHEQHLLAHANQSLFDYADPEGNGSPTGNNIGSFQSRGSYRCVPTAAAVMKSSNQDIPASDAFSLNGYTMLAWLDGNTLRVQITDDLTGAIATTNAFPSLTFGVVAPGAGFQTAGYVTTGGATIFYLTCRGFIIRCLGGGNGTWNWGGLQSPALGGPWFQSRLYINAATDRLFLGMLSTDGAHVGGVVYSNTLTVIGSGTHNLANVDTACWCAVTYYSTTNNYVVAYRNLGGNLVYDTFSPTTGAFGTTSGGIAVDQYQHLTVYQTGSALTAFHDNLATYGSYKSFLLTTDLANGSGNVNLVVMRGVSLASDIITYGNSSYMEVVYYSVVIPTMSAAVLAASQSTNGGIDPRVFTLNSGTFVIDLNGVVCARVLRGASLPMTSTSSASASAAGVVFATRALSQAESTTIDNALSLGAAAVVRFNLTQERARGVSAFRSHLGVGGSALSYDGDIPAEANFHLYPEIQSALFPNEVGSFGKLTLTVAEALWNKRNTNVTAGDLRGQIGLAINDAGAGMVWACVQSGKTQGSTPAAYFGGGPLAYPAVGTVVLDGTSRWQCLGFGLQGTAYAAGLTVFCGTVLTQGGLLIVVTNTSAGATGSTTTAGSPAFPGPPGTVSLSGTTYSVISSAYTQLANGKGYTYAACYSWVDAAGLLHRSALSPTAGITMLVSTNGLTNVPVIFITTMRMSLKVNVRIEVYRTAGDGTVLQQIATLPNQPSADLVAFYDTTLDALQALGAVAYQGPLGASGLPNRPPPTCTAVAVFGQRVFANSLETPNIVYPSQLINPGYGVSWADELALVFNGANGGVNAMQQMDDKLVFFQDRAISYITGDGPDNTGGGTGFSLPQLLPTDVGCLNPDSVVLTPAGIFFQAPKGIYLLTRNMAVEFVGEPMRDDIVTQVFSAAVDPNTHQVLFVTQDPSTVTTIVSGLFSTANTGGETGYTPAPGAVYVYDWENDAWANWQVKTAITPSLVNSLVAWGRLLVLIDGAGHVIVQSPAKVNTYLTVGGVPILMSVELAPERLDQAVAGFGRVRAALLNFYSSSGNQQVNAKVHYDYNDDSADSGTAFTSLVLAAGHDAIELRFAKRRCTALTLEINEGWSGVNAKDLVLEGITLELGILGGLTPKPTNRRAF